MGYQLVFWKQKGRSDSASEAQAICEGLTDLSDVEGVLPMPVAEILSSLGNDFPELGEVTADSAGPVFWVSDDEQNSIEFNWSALHFFAEFRPFGPSAHAHANRIIDVLVELECPLYDPQQGERFDKPFAS